MYKMNGRYDPYTGVYRPASPSTNYILVKGELLDLEPYFSAPPEDYQNDSSLAAVIAKVLAPSWEGEWGVQEMKDLLHAIEEYFGAPVEVGMIGTRPGLLQQAGAELGILRKW